MNTIDKNSNQQQLSNNQQPQNSQPQQIPQQTLQVPTQNDPHQNHHSTDSIQQDNKIPLTNESTITIDNTQPNPFTFKDKNIRNNFIKKVFSIVCVQLVFTALMSIYAINDEKFPKFVQSHQFIMILSSITMIMITYMLLCCQDQFARKFPLNYILLSIFTLAESYLVSFICTTYKSEVVFQALVLTMVMVISLTIYAWTTQTDFTACGGILFMLCMVSLGMGIMLMFTKNDFLHLIYCWLGIVMGGVYLIYDVQLIVGGKSRQLQIDDYIIGALLLYVDIIYLFLRILELLGKNNNQFMKIIFKLIKSRKN